MRCADLGPIPGSRPSSSIRSWTAAAYILYRHYRPMVLIEWSSRPLIREPAHRRTVRARAGRSAQQPATGPAGRRVRHPRPCHRGPGPPRRAPARPRRARRPGSDPAAYPRRPGSTTDGSIVTCWNSRPPVARTRTAPPPGAALQHLGRRRLLGLLEVLLHLAQLGKQGSQVGNGLLFVAHGDTSSAPGNASSRRCSGEITAAGASSRSSRSTSLGSSGGRLGPSAPAAVGLVEDQPQGHGPPEVRRQGRLHLGPVGLGPRQQALVRHGEDGRVSSTPTNRPADT